MGFLDSVLNKKDKDVDDYEEDLEKLKIQTEIQGVKTELQERQALEKELKSKYGSGWKKVLGLKGWVSVPTLKSALKSELSSSTGRIRGHGL